MKKRNILIAAIAVSIISLSAIVACSKESPTTNESVAPSKKALVDHALQSHLNRIWHLTDSSYKADSKLILSAAAKEDTNLFSSITHISKYFVSGVNHLFDIRHAGLTVTEPEKPYCKDCDKHALSNYVNKYVVLKSILDSIHTYDSNFVDSTILMIPDNVTPCEYECIWKHKNEHLDGWRLVLCYENCLMTHHIDDAVEHLEAIREKPLGIE